MSPPEMMEFSKKLLNKLFCREENIFLGLWFLMFCRQYHAPFGCFEVPLTFSKCHFYSRFLNNTYEIEERTLVEKHIRPGDHVLELGGCAGIVSCLTSRLIKGGRHCVAEANPFMLPYLYRNREKNDGDFFIVAAAASKEKTLPFYIHKNMVGSSALRQTSIKYQIACLPLNILIQHYGPFNTLIMDIEGGEADFIVENQESLHEFNKLIIEFHPTILGPDKTSLLYGQLEELGFKSTETIGTVSYFLRQ